MMKISKKASMFLLGNKKVSEPPAPKSPRSDPPMDDRVKENYPPLLPSSGYEQRVPHSARPSYDKPKMYDQYLSAPASASPRAVRHRPSRQELLSAPSPQRSHQTRPLTPPPPQSVPCYSSHSRHQVQPKVPVEYHSFDPFTPVDSIGRKVPQPSPALFGAPKTRVVENVPIDALEYEEELERDLSPSSPVQTRAGSRRPGNGLGRSNSRAAGPPPSKSQYVAEALARDQKAHLKPLRLVQRSSEASLRTHGSFTQSAAGTAPYNPQPSLRSARSFTQPVRDSSESLFDNAEIIFKPAGAVPGLQHGIKSSLTCF